MKWRVTQMALIAALCVSLFGCTAMTGESAKANVNDAAITTAVKAKLAGDRMASLTRVDVETVKGTVYLTGIVPDSAAKLRAQEIAQKVDGVANVVNDLKTQSTVAGDMPGAGDTPHSHSQSHY
jgi:hyperosmotically inducible protein